MPVVNNSSLFPLPFCLFPAPPDAASSLRAQPSQGRLLLRCGFRRRMGDAAFRSGGLRFVLDRSDRRHRGHPGGLHVLAGAEVLQHVRRVLVGGADRARFLLGFSLPISATLLAVETSWRS